ncbi:MAG: ABC transporter ATP-binding protein [Betaproteobacteria bacterium]|jgi:lipoprotein-releasing system ATP-binding protein|nr:ABC transporter ATP-binding protein [Betaproteobacteria bacterium]
MTSKGSAMTLLEGKGLKMVFGDGAGEVVALPGVDLMLSRGETVAVVGASGAGKSTLLHILGGLERPTAGEVWLEGRSLYAMPDAERTRLRNTALGFVYQFHHLLPEFTAEENVAMPLLIRRLPAKQALQQAAEMLAAVGLQARRNHTPAMLSGGERQRVAIARALVTQPSCVLADEPTGNLDRQTASRVFEVFLDRVRNQQCGLVVVTHDPELAQRCDRVISL